MVIALNIIIFLTEKIGTFCYPSLDFEKIKEDFEKIKVRNFHQQIPFSFESDGFLSN